MRFATSTVLLGTATSASAALFAQDAQHVLSDGFDRVHDAVKPVADSFAGTRESLEEAVSGMSD